MSDRSEYLVVIITFENQIIRERIERDKQQHYKLNKRNDGHSHEWVQDADCDLVDVCAICGELRA